MKSFTWFRNQRTLKWGLIGGYEEGYNWGRSKWIGPKTTATINIRDYNRKKLIARGIVTCNASAAIGWRFCKNSRGRARLFH